MSEKRELVLKAFRGESVDRVPVGFWHHFTTEDEWLHGFENPEIIDKNNNNEEDVEKLHIGSIGSCIIACLRICARSS